MVEQVSAFGHFADGLAVAEDLDLLPTISAEIRFPSASGAVAYDGAGGSTGIASTSFEAVTVGIGIVVREQLTVRPTFFQPIGLKNGKTAIGFSASWSFGH